MKRKQLISALGAVGFGMAIAGSASAGIAVYSPTWSFEDDDIEYIYDLDSSGTITKGDRIVTAGEFTNSRGSLAGQGPSAITPEELTFVADHTILTAIDIGGVAKRFVLAPTAGGLNSGYGASVMASIFVDPTADLDVTNGVCGTHTGTGTAATDCMLAAGLGATVVPGSGSDGSTLWALIGFGNPGDVWVTGIIDNANISLATIQAGDGATAFVNYSYFQSILLNNTGVALALNTFPCAPFCNGLGGDGFADVAGSGNLLGGQGLTAANWTGRSDNDVSARVAVPEPGSLALLGVALAGIAAIRRRKESGA